MSFDSSRRNNWSVGSSLWVEKTLAMAKGLALKLSLQFIRPKPKSRLNDKNRLSWDSDKVLLED